MLQNCNRCETIPNKIEGKGTLYLWFPVGHTTSKVISALDQINQSYQLIEDSEGCTVSFDTKDEELINALTSRLTGKELKETQALWISGTAAPQFRDFSRVTSLHNFISLNKAEWLLDVLASERLTSYFQPIVYAEDTSRIFAQEALLRGFDEQGNIISPGLIFSHAYNAGLVFQLDALARKIAIREANHHGIEQLIFINFSPSAVYDPTTCLRMTVQAINEAGISHDRVVFEVMESEQPPDIKHLTKILRFYQDAGFQIALDDFGTGYSNLNLISELSPDFIKIDRNLISNIHQDPNKAFITKKLLEIAQHLQIKTIAEGVETVEELNWARENHATFIQGFLIAKPQSPPVTSTVEIKSESRLI